MSQGTGKRGEWESRRVSRNRAGPDRPLPYWDDGRRGGAREEREGRVVTNHTKSITVNRREIVSKLRLHRPGFETKVKGFMTLVAVVRWCIGVDGMTG